MARAERRGTRQETFGPLLSVIAYDSKDEAILIAIDSSGHYDGLFHYGCPVKAETSVMKSFEMIEIRREGCDLRLGQAGGDRLHDQ